MVQPGMPLLEVVDLSTVWVEAEAGPEYELPWIRPGQHAVVTLTYLPGQTFHGRVEYIYPYLQGSTRTARVRIKIPNPQLKLKPEMFAQAEIAAPLGKTVVAVPSEAVLNTGEKQYVFLSLGQGRFEPREVKLGVDNGEGWLESYLRPEARAGGGYFGPIPPGLRVPVSRSHFQYAKTCWRGICRCPGSRFDRCPRSRRPGHGAYAA